MSWDGARRRFWKVERRQVYDQRGDESYDAWARGDAEGARRLLAETLWAQAAMYREATERGLDLLRLRLVDEPLSENLRTYEIPNYSVSEQLGEPIVIALLPPDDTLPDCIAFGEDVLFVNVYDGRGRPAGAIEIRDPEAVRATAPLNRDAVGSESKSERVPRRRGRLLGN